MEGRTGGFEIKEVRVFSVSAAWIGKRFDCTAEHITSEGGCGGSCCIGDVFWPAKLYDDKKCGFLGEHGCVLPLEERPVTCLLFPIVPNKDNRLILFHRSMFKKGMCKGAFGKGPLLLDSQKEVLVMLFGEEQYNKVRRDVLAGKDSMFVVTDEVWECFQRDMHSEDNGIKPKPRSHYRQGGE